MARIVKDRIKQPSTTTGTGTITLSGSVAGFQAFSVLGDGSTTFYCIEDANGIAFEVGIGTYTGNTLARTTILESSSSGNAISLTSGTHTAFVTYPAERAGFNDEGLSPALTASGTVTAGKPVIQNTNGTVTQVAETPDAAISPGLGSALAITPAGSSGRLVASDCGVNGQRVIACRSDTTGSSNYNINLRVATVSTTDLKTVTYSGLSTLTVGTAVKGIGIIYHENAGKYIICWEGASNYLYGCVLTVSGTGSTATVSAGTTLTIVSTDITGFESGSMCYDTVNNFVIITYEEYFARTSSLTISGTTLSVASAISLASDIEIKGIPKCAWNKYHGVVVYIFQSQSEDLYYNLATPSNYGYIPVSGSNKGLVDSVANWPDRTTCVSCDPDSGETVIIGPDGDNKRGQGGNTIWGTSGTRSGFTITWGTFTQFSNVIFMGGSGAGGTALKPIENGKMIYFMGTQTNSPTLPYRPVYGIVTTSGTSISYSSPASAGSQQTYGVTYLSLAVNFSKTQALMSWGDTGTADAITSVALLQTSQNGQAPNLTATNYLGIASDTVANNENATIQTQGAVNPDQSSLTPGQLYYVQTDGTLSTTAGSPSVVAGIATSATTILVTRS